MSTLSPTSQAQKDEYRRALEKIEALHGNMAVLSRLGRLLRDPNTDITDISRLLQTDGALCVNVIRVSNSFQYGTGPRTTHVHDALVKVGFNRILSLISSAVSRQVFMQNLSAYGLSSNEYWAHSYFCAVFLEGQAQRCGVPADDAYLVGLLHALGRVVINELLVKTHIEVFWDRSIPCEEWEEILVGFSSAKASSYLLEKWKFGPEVHKRIAIQNSTEAQAKDPLLLTLDFGRACSELNHFELNTPNWIFPEDHAFCQSPGFDFDQMSAEIERAKQVCLQTGKSLVAT